MTWMTEKAHWFDDHWLLLLLMMMKVELVLRWMWNDITGIKRQIEIHGRLEQLWWFGPFGSPSS
jgi:hypothetical protein